MSEFEIRRRLRTANVTLHTTTALADTLNLQDMAGGVVSFGTMSTNAATLQMFGSNDTLTEFRRVYNADGSAADVTLAPSSTVGRIYSLPDSVFALPYLKIISGTTNSTGTVGVVSFKS
jgi:hypothetical protein